MAEKVSAAGVIAARQKDEGSVVSFDDVKALVPEKKIPLSKPIKVMTADGGDRTVSELVFRLPTLEDMAAVNSMPYKTYGGAGGRMEIVPDMQAVKAWATRLCGTRYSKDELGTLCARDSMAIYNWLCQEMYGAAEEDGGNS